MSVTEIVRPQATSALQKPVLSWSTAARIAWRELHASMGKFMFVVLSVAIGVAALTGVRGLSEAFTRTLFSLEVARCIKTLAADYNVTLSISLMRESEPAK